MLDEIEKMIAELEADVEKKHIEIERMQEKVFSREQEYNDIKSLLLEDDPEFDASEAMLSELESAMRDDKAEMAACIAEVGELRERQQKIREIINGVNDTMRFTPEE